MQNKLQSLFKKDLTYNCMRWCFLILMLIFAFLPSVNARLRGNNYDVNKALPWVAGYLPDNSDKVRYKVAYGEGITYQQAREEATASLILELGWEHGITVESKTVDEIKHSINNNESNFSQKRNTTTYIEQDGYTASITKIDEYSELDKKNTETIKYKVWQLYAINCPWASQINLKYSTKYGFGTAGWRSIIIPGWGQFYKKQYIKGSLFLVTELAGISTSMYFHSRYNSNLKHSFETPILDLQIEYTKRANKQKLYRNISIGACAAVWVLNVLDAVLLEGRPRYIESDFDFAFTTTNSSEIALSLLYKF